MMYEKIVLVRRKTRLEELIERFNTRGQAQFYIEHSGGDFGMYEREHATYQDSLHRLRHDLGGLLRLHEIERGYLPTYTFTETDLVVTVGIDGLVVNTAKYLNGQPVVAVNPDPQHIDGILLPFQVPQASGAVQNVLQGKARLRQVSMAEARLNDGQSLLAFNDLFIGARSHVSARYTLQAGPRAERHSSSGIIISTGAGSTGWLSSLFHMANGMLTGFGGQGSPKPQPAQANSSDLSPYLSQPRLDWEAEQLIFVVREPFASKASGASLVCGPITPSAPLVVRSEMAEGGVIFSDGVEADYLAFNAGMVATINIAAKKTRLVVDK
jgi:NAD kinase